MKTLISIVGPTAVGKTHLSILLATHFQTAILSSDSRQMYQYMNIGTAKPTPEEKQGIPHYFIDSLKPNQSYNAGQFERDAESLLEKLFKKHDVVISVGGSTLYIDALWNGIDEMPYIDPVIRVQLNWLFTSEGMEPLLAELKSVDPETWQRIDRKNPARVIRALEVFRGTGTPISAFRKGPRNKERTYNLIKIGLELEREQLYQRINKRVEHMMAEGLEEEVKMLLDMGYHQKLPAMQSIGYREFFPYFQGEYPLEEAVRLIQRNSRRYAKRQFTWFRKDESIQWFPSGQWQQVWDWLSLQLTQNIH